jgi:hypothetical protein
LVFETSGLKAVKKFFDNGKSPIFEQGRKDGWLTGKWRENYFASAAASESRHHDTSAPSQVLRLPGADAGPAAAVPERLGHLLRRARPRRALQGLVESFRLARRRRPARVAEHPVQRLRADQRQGLDRSEWRRWRAPRDQELQGHGALRRRACPRPVHTPSIRPPARAQAFNEIKPKIAADGIYKEPSRFVYGEVMNTSDDFIKAGSVVDLEA